MEIFDNTMSALEKGIANTTKAQEVISQNIANANTPGYVPKQFDEVLNEAVERQDRRSVNIEEEMADMSKNTTRNAAYAKLLSTKMAILRNVISQGRK